MTTTIKRGAGRPAANAKTTKAAQRTALPANDDADARGAMQVPLAPSEPIGLEQQTQGQLLATARGLGLSPAARMPKAKLIELIRAHKPAKPATPTAEAAEEPTPAETPAKPASGQESQPGAAKLARLKEALEPFGWKVSAKTTGDRIEATAKRGTAQIRLVWVDGAYDYGASSYNGRKVRNLSEAIRLCAVKAAD